jgi:hypothetical protein
VVVVVVEVLEGEYICVTVTASDAAVGVASVTVALDAVTPD